MPVHGVLFDLDDTLLDHAGSVAAALDAWLPTLGVTPDPAAHALWSAALERHLVAWRERRISFAEQRRRRLRDFLPAVGVGYDEADLDSVFDGYLGAYQAAYRIFPDVDDTLAALSSAGIATAVLTNGINEQQHDKLARVGLKDRVGPVFTAEDLGVTKPDPAAFRLTCSRWGLPPSEVLSVGDRHDLDVLPARLAGLRAAHLDRRDTGPNDEPHRLTTLHALPSFLSS